MLIGFFLNPNRSNVISQNIKTHYHFVNFTEWEKYVSTFFQNIILLNGNKNVYVKTNLLRSIDVVVVDE